MMGITKQPGLKRKGSVAASHTEEKDGWLGDELRAARVHEQEKKDEGVERWTQRARERVETERFSVEEGWCFTSGNQSERFR